MKKAILYFSIYSTILFSCGDKEELINSRKLTSIELIYDGLQVSSSKMNVEYEGERIVKVGTSKYYYNEDGKDRKSTRLNSSHVKISYAVFCLKKKNT